MSKWTKAVAGAIIAIAVILLAYALLTPEETADDTDHMGMNGRMVYSSADVGIIGIALVLIVAAVMVIALWHEYEPLPPSMMPPPKAVEASVAAEAIEAPPAAPEPRPVVATADEEAGRNYLVLRLLTGDERTMFKAIMDSGGEALQKELILRTKMSNAKVSRVLDRLSQKGVITKERYGATNKVKIRIER